MPELAGDVKSRPGVMTGTAGEQVSRRALRMDDNGVLRRFQLRVLQDALNEGSAVYWLRRAAQFDAARSRPADFRGQASEADVAAADSRLSALAASCRARASLTFDAEPCTLSEFLEASDPR